MITTEYGPKIAGAIKAVAQMHADTNKLLVDCDRHIGKGRKSLFGSYATRDLTYHVRADHWMPEGVFRYYEAGPLLADGVSVTFFNGAKSTAGQYDGEPLLKVARIQYSAPGVQSQPDSDEGALKAVCDGWDMWWIFFKHAQAKTLGKVLTCDDADEGRIAWSRLAAVPYSRLSELRTLPI